MEPLPAVKLYLSLHKPQFSHLVSGVLGPHCPGSGEKTLGKCGQPYRGLTNPGPGLAQTQDAASALQMVASFFLFLLWGAGGGHACTL